MAKHKKERETKNPIGLKINEVLREKNLIGDYAAVANVFGVAVPSVYGWVDKGRISKARFAMLESWSGKSVTWWLDSGLDSTDSSIDRDFNNWRTTVSSRAQFVIDQITSLAQQQVLADDDWLLLHSIAKRLAVNSQRSTDPQDLPLEINADAQDVIDKRVREAQQRREQTQQQGQLLTKKRAA